jgi:hypothetical protein
MQQGGVQAANSLAGAGYESDSRVEGNRTYVDFYQIGSVPPPGVPFSVRAAWENAFAAVTPNNGQTDGGVRDMGPAAVGGVKGGDNNGDAAATSNGSDAALAVRKAHARALVAAA